ncbi:hypothetical protein A0H81_13769 [Grifola frondosa]|uniref:KAP NTPase domain-containing protein n=1 Tax=Grifola frondosa TaxID=5627 RepID=A0A1C7LNY9_GRIFR|nr:hypothetical protein A0H81_13769 [Grifola frondosa]
MEETGREVALIAVMGPTGSGKTTFINLVSGSNLQVGKSLKSCTDELIDTAGFDDTEKTQADVLREIAAYLKTSYEDGRLLTGIIYMHRISDRRIGGIARESFRLFRKTCGDGAMQNVVIVTNMWGDVRKEDGEARERELMTDSLFFKDALDHGARMLRHHNTLESAHAIIREMMENVPKALNMQREMVDEHRGIADTEAGRVLQMKLDQQEEKHKMEIKVLRDEINRLLEQLKTSSLAHQQEINDLRSAHDRLNRKVEQIEVEKEKLRQPLPLPRWRELCLIM